MLLLIYLTEILTRFTQALLLKILQTRQKTGWPEKGGFVA